MLNRLLRHGVALLAERILKRKIREGSIKAVKGYLHLVRGARSALLGLFALGLTGSVLVSGVVLAVVGAVGLLPIATATMSVVILVIGLCMALSAAVAVVIVFSQRRWLKVSRSYELMDTVLAPWKGADTTSDRDMSRPSESLRMDQSREVHAGRYPPGSRDSHDHAAPRMMP